MLVASGMTVLISDYLEYYRLAAYVGRTTRAKIGISMGIGSLRELFDENRCRRSSHPLVRFGATAVLRLPGGDRCSDLRLEISAAIADARLVEGVVFRQDFPQRAGDRFALLA